MVVAVRSGKPEASAAGYDNHQKIPWKKKFQTQIVNSHFTLSPELTKLPFTANLPFSDVISEIIQAGKEHKIPHAKVKTELGQTGQMIESDSSFTAESKTTIETENYSLTFIQGTERSSEIEYRKMRRGISAGIRKSTPYSQLEIVIPGKKMQITSGISGTKIVYEEYEGNNWKRDKTRFVKGEVYDINGKFILRDRFEGSFESLEIRDLDLEAEKVLAQIDPKKHQVYISGASQRLPDTFPPYLNLRKSVGVFGEEEIHHHSRSTIAVMENIARKLNDLFLSGAADSQRTSSPEITSLPPDPEFLFEEGMPAKKRVEYALLKVLASIHTHFSESAYTPHKETTTVGLSAEEAKIESAIMERSTTRRRSITSNAWNSGESAEEAILNTLLALFKEERRLSSKLYPLHRLLELKQTELDLQTRMQIVNSEMEKVKERLQLEGDTAEAELSEAAPADEPNGQVPSIGEVFSPAERARIASAGLLSELYSLGKSSNSLSPVDLESLAKYGIADETIPLGNGQQVSPICELGRTGVIPSNGLMPPILRPDHEIIEEIFKKLKLIEYEAKMPINSHNGNQIEAVSLFPEYNAEIT